MWRRNATTIASSHAAKGPAPRDTDIILTGSIATDEAIAARLQAEGHYPCRSTAFTPQIVLKLRSRHGIRLGRATVRAGGLPDVYTVREVARLLGVDPSWIYRAIGDERILVAKDARYGCYLFAHKEATIEALRQLKAGQVQQVSFRKEHSNG